MQLSNLMYSSGHNDIMEHGKLKLPLYIKFMVKPRDI